MGWIYLAVAIVAEIAGTVSLRYTEGFTRLWPTLGVMSLYAVSFGCVARAIRTIELSAAYAIWSGVGTAAIAVIGVWFFREPVNTLKVVSLVLVIAGVIGLRLGGAN